MKENLGQCQSFDIRPEIVASIAWRDSFYKVCVRLEKSLKRGDDSWRNPMATYSLACRTLMAAQAAPVGHPGRVALEGWQQLFKEDPRCTDYNDWLNQAVERPRYAWKVSKLFLQSPPAMVVSNLGRVLLDLPNQPDANALECN